jgi:hypothetical protein
MSRFFGDEVQYLLSKIRTNKTLKEAADQLELSALHRF